MHLTDVDDVLATGVTRRRVVRSGVKVAYAAPLVAATMRLSAGGAAAAASGPPCAGAGDCPESLACVDGRCVDPCALLDCGACPSCAVTRAGVAWCQCKAPGVCLAGACATIPCASDADCAASPDLFCETGIGFCLDRRGFGDK
jgi:hypothetical protein